MRHDHRLGDRSPGRNRRAAFALVVGALLVPFLLLAAAERALAADLDPLVTLDIGPDTPLDKALLDLADKANLFLSAGSLAGYLAAPIKGTYPVREALRLLLGGSDLAYRIRGRTIYISPSAQPALRQAESGVGSEPPEGDQREHTAKDKAVRRRRNSERKEEGDHTMQEVTIEGHIPGSPLNVANIVLTRSDFEAGGFQTVGDVLRSLPQSFGGGLNVGVISAGGSQNTISQSAASTANLRGLGSDSTLVLINGQRIATAEGSGAVDVSLIPISAVERIEISTGSASALYGSDAVAGVVNIIIRTDFQGVELTSALGTATGGGNFLQHYSVVAGHANDDTNVFIAGDCAWQREIDSEQRAYIPMAIAGTTLLPRTQHCSALLSGTRSLPHGLEASVLGVYTRRSAFQAENLSLLSSGVTATTEADVDQYAVGGSLTWHFLETWTGAVSASISADNVNSPEVLSHGGVAYQQGGDRFDNRLVTGQAVASGTLADTRMGPLQLALGAGYNDQEFVFENLPGGEFSLGQQRRIYFAFGESNIPLVPSAAGAKNPSALSLDIAVRAEHYSDVGTTTNPKVALAYEPTSSVRISASWGTSFRAPSLLQQFDHPQALLEFVPDMASSNGQSLGLLRFGGNPRLRPEKSTDTGLDLTLTPTYLPGATVQISYYNIFYRHRIEYPTPNTSDPLSDRNSWPFVTRNPTSAYIAQVLEESQFIDFTAGQGNPRDVTVVVDDRNQNVARQKASGVDLLSKYIRPTTLGRVETSLNIAYLELQQQITNLSESLPLSGTVFYPPTWRGRFGINWSNSRYLGSLFVNYTGGSRQVSSQGEQSTAIQKPIASWTTVDAQIGAVLDSGAHWGSTKLTLSAQNVLDRHPPLISLSQPGPTGINYDSTNTSPVGRFVTLQLTQMW